MVIVMKIEISILAGLLILATELMARASVQGVERAIVSTVIEWTMSRMKAQPPSLRGDILERDDQPRIWHR